MSLTCVKSTLLLVVASVALAACGGGGAGPPAGDLTIQEAMDSADEGPLSVKGYIVAPEGGPIRLCSALLESYPPQCGEPSLVVLGLDLETVGGLTSTTDPSLAQVTWSDAELSLLGEVADGVITISKDMG
jgi:hypothetical protein